jgi:hypothetical protein
VTPNSGCFKPITILRSTTLGKADYTTVKNHFYYTQILFEYQHSVLYNKGKGFDFYEGWKEKLRCFKTFLSNYDFCGTPKKDEMAAMSKI